MLYFACRIFIRHTEIWTREIPPLDGGAEGATGFSRETLRQKDLVLAGIPFGVCPDGPLENSLDRVPKG